MRAPECTLWRTPQGSIKGLPATITKSDSRPSRARRGCAVARRRAAIPLGKPRLHLPGDHADIIDRNGLDLSAWTFAPWLLGCPGTPRQHPVSAARPRIRATAQNGRPRHGLASGNISSERKNEQSSGLLIRGFGVRVPGGAPVLTWGFIAPGPSFSIFCGAALRPSWGPYDYPHLERACGFVRPAPGHRHLPRRAPSWVGPAAGSGVQLASVPSRPVSAWGPLRAAEMLRLQLGGHRVRLRWRPGGGAGRSGEPDGPATVVRPSSGRRSERCRRADDPWCPAAVVGAGCRGPGIPPG